MTIEVRRFGQRRATIVLIDGEPHLLREAAAKRGLTSKAFQKRIQRGTSLEKPPQRHVSE